MALVKKKSQITPFKVSAPEEKTDLREGGGGVGGGTPVEVFPGSTDQQWTTTRTAGPSCSNGRALAGLAISPENNQSQSSVDHGVLLAQPGVESRRKINHNPPTIGPHCSQRKRKEEEQGISNAGKF